MAYSRPNSKLDMILKYIELATKTGNAVAIAALEPVKGIINNDYAIRRVTTTQLVRVKDGTEHKIP